MKHLFVKAAARLNNRAEDSHQPTRERERRMRGFRKPKRTQEFLACFGSIRQYFALERHLLARITVSQIACGEVCCLVRVHRTRPNPVDWILNDRQTFQRFVSRSAS